nr:toxin YdaT family protein [Enterobacter hormaechei]
MITHNQFSATGDAKEVENLEELKREIFNWAVERGQEHVAIEITRMWFRLGGNTSTVKLHQMEDPMGNADWRAINNNRQQIFRWLRGDTKAARAKTRALAKAMEAALPAERYAQLGMTTQHLICVAIREFAAAIIALLLDARDRPQKIAQALQAIQETQRLTSV